MRTAGVDLASKDLNTALCVIDWNRRRIDTLRVNVTDADIVDVVATVDRTGIDAPFGWPAPFVDAVTAWMDGGAWGGEDTHVEALTALRYRATDLIVKQDRIPLSVSTDLISITAFRCARLLTLVENVVGGVDRSGCSGPVCEVYPGAALQRWGLPSRGYKRGVGAEPIRSVIADGVAVGAGINLDHPKIEAMHASDHVLDAFVAAVSAACVLRGLSTEPGPDGDLLARTEGWIHVPLPDALSRLAKGS